eukprot:TRINITY_DN327_c0_g1_i12.p1 TRINITY_DN327_c0_g1~~TRINITY_DN327_c0_g1_i12.p1  ORF type:complete len:227 (+),score=-22.90 TRINITY_DN327_c0_g1_i12:263-943(+)
MEQYLHCQSQKSILKYFQKLFSYVRKYTFYINLQCFNSIGKKPMIDQQRIIKYILSITFSQYKINGQLIQFIITNKVIVQYLLLMGHKMIVQITQVDIQLKIIFCFIYLQFENMIKFSIIAKKHQKKYNKFIHSFDNLLLSSTMLALAFHSNRLFILVGSTLVATILSWYNPGYDLLHENSPILVLFLDKLLLLHRSIQQQLCGYLDMQASSGSSISQLTITITLQ